jgi:hypothetical protein
MKKLKTGYTPHRTCIIFIENVVECEESKCSRLLCIAYTLAAQQSRGRINVNN